MPRHNRIERRAGARVAVVIDSIEHALTETGFIELMKQGLDVLQALTAERSRSHRAADPHCTCNDCVAYHADQTGAREAAHALLAPRQRRRRTSAPDASLRAAAGEYAGVDVAQLRTRVAADGSTRCRATFEDGGRARFTVRVALAAVTAADIEDFESLE